MRNLRVAYCLLLTAYCTLQVANYKLRSHLPFFSQLAAAHHAVHG